MENFSLIFSVNCVVGVVTPLKPKNAPLNTTLGRKHSLFININREESTRHYVKITATLMCFCISWDENVHRVEEFYRRG